MKRTGWMLGFALVLGFPLLVFTASTAQGEDEKKPGYIGALTCAKVCHKTAKQGKQLSLWQAAGHANAFATLATEEAKAIAKEKGIEDPQKSDQCLKCHTTAHGVASELLGAKFSHEEGVGCEVCHGPGSLYKKRSVMKDREKSIAAGLLIPDEKTCLKCHNEESPTYMPFDYEERLAEIAHLKPKAE